MFCMTCIHCVCRHEIALIYHIFINYGCLPHFFPSEENLVPH